ncbi:MAG: SRPBCC family protein [Acidobacteriota bacterium]|nr:SRPBCC family protein [Acidobacteriota bacterium]
MANDDFSSVQITHEDGGWRLSCSQRVAHAVNEVYPFFATAHNLERITPSFLHFRIRRISTEPLTAGALIDYTLWLHHLPVWWRTQIDDWEPPYRFVDRQIRGPFKHWVHTHRFEADGDGTLIRDEVRFDLHCRALWRRRWLGWVHDDLRRIFAYRRRAVAVAFEP